MGFVSAADADQSALVVDHRMEPRPGGVTKGQRGHVDGQGAHVRTSPSRTKRRGPSRPDTCRRR